jgi:hypothetical protein
MNNQSQNATTAAFSRAMRDVFDSYRHECNGGIRQGLLHRLLGRIRQTVLHACAEKDALRGLTIKALLLRDRIRLGCARNILLLFLAVLAISAKAQVTNVAWELVTNRAPWTARSGLLE